MANFTPTQGRYLSFIHTYTELHGIPPAEAEIARAMCVSPPSVNTMVKSLERKGLIQRQPGTPRSIRVLVPADEIPSWRGKKRDQAEAAPTAQPVAKDASPPPSPVNLYMFKVFLSSGPIDEKFASKVISRAIEIRGDQTLADLHQAIYGAFDRWEEHLYEFQLGKRPFDPDGPNYGVDDSSRTKLDDLKLTRHRVFGYWFDPGDNWFHQVELEKIETAIPTVQYPRVIRRVGKSPPQYAEE